MITIWKYPLEVTDVQEIIVPGEYEFLTVQMQNGSPMLWARVDTEVDSKSRVRIEICGTGNPASSKELTKYIATFQMGPLVFHVFYYLR